MNRALAAWFFLLTTILLIGGRFGFVWAGGPGYAPPLAVSVSALQGGDATADRNGVVRALVRGATVARGETVSTGPATRLALTASDGSQIVLDERTEVKLESLQPTDLSVWLTKGRLFLVDRGEGQTVTVDTVGTQIGILQQAMTVVNYDFLQTIEAAPFHTSLGVLDTQNGFVTSGGVKIHEVDPVTVTDEHFDANGSTAADFYTWAENETGFTLP